MYIGNEFLEVIVNIKKFFVRELGGSIKTVGPCKYFPTPSHRVKRVLIAPKIIERNTTVKERFNAIES